jgi:outer membrane lipoprotein-sorting protein
MPHPLHFVKIHKTKIKLQEYGYLCGQMKKMKTKLIALSLLLGVFSLNLFAQSDAKKMLDAVSTKFKSYTSVQASFQLKIENNAGKLVGSKKGTVMMKGTKYKVIANEQEIYCDGSNTWNFDKSANEVTINKVDPTANTITPQKIFTNFYDKDFTYRLNGDKKEGGVVCKEIELTPVDKTKPFTKVLLYVSNATINCTKVMEKTGNKYTYSISNMKTGQSMKDALFAFDAGKYPGVEVVDLR